MLRFQLKPSSFIRAALLHVRDGRDIAPCQDSPDLLGDWGDNADDPHVVRRYQELKVREAWGRELENPHVRKLVFFNMRHGSPDWAMLAQGIGELLTNGPQHLLRGTSSVSRGLVKRKNQVVREIHRLTGYTRLMPAPDGTMVGRAPSKHHTGDLIAVTLARRNPQLPLAILTPMGSYFAWQGKITPLAAQYSDLPDDGFGQVWLAYYRTQFIRERNNPRHAARAIPQEYWQWMDEGRELIKAKNEMKP